MPVFSAAPDPPERDTKELRIALVCYGGVSLAVYMHGVTRELECLARASAAYAGAPEKNPFPAGSVEDAYWRVFDECARRDGYVTRVVIDIVAGTSAGGINGICLAKAVAHNRSQEALRTVWLEQADVNELMANPLIARVPTRAGKLVAWGLTAVAGRVLGAGRPPFDGARMLRWIHDALATMDAREAADGRPSLLPDGHPLRLFVTLTDLHGYNRRVPIHDPRRVTDRRHRHVLEFSSRDGHFRPHNNAALAFAARTTASFPGAFPPTRLADVEALADRGWDAERFAAEQFAIYRLSEASAADTHFIDGGVLDNYPFEVVVEAIHMQPASVQVDRRLLYIEPDPPGGVPRPSAEGPDLLRTVWAGLSGLPRQEPILDALLRLRAFNERVARIRDVVQRHFDQVAAEVEAGNETTYDALNARLIADAGRKAPLGFAPYTRLKIHAVVGRFAALANQLLGYPRDSVHAAFVSDALLAWARMTGLLVPAEPGDEARRFLRSFDLDYAERRIRFVIQGLNELYRTAMPGLERAHLNRTKRRLYDLIHELSTVVETVKDVEAVRAVFGTDVITGYLDDGGAESSVEAFVRSHRPAIDELRDRLDAELTTRLHDFGARVFDTVETAIATWPEDARRRIHVRLVGFPLWDMLIFPLRQVGDVGELDAVEVVRVSPRDAHLLDTAFDTEKLRGAPLGHFAAFFSREARENDYLWGRLDAAERLIHVLLNDAAAGPGDAPSSPLYGRAFAAIVADEERHLRAVPDLMRALHASLALLKPRRPSLRRVA
jgi:patatin-related protein